MKLAGALLLWVGANVAGSANAAKALQENKGNQPFLCGLRYPTDSTEDGMEMPSCQPTNRVIISLKSNHKL